MHDFDRIVFGFTGGFEPPITSKVRGSASAGLFIDPETLIAKKARLLTSENNCVMDIRD